MMSYGQLSYAYGMVLSAAFNGAGDTTTPTILNLICFWACQIPLGYYLAVPFGMGPKGAWAAIVVANTLLAALAIVLFRRGSWKRTVV
jgi:Na+-driven multidrug efflux pump